MVTPKAQISIDFVIGGRGSGGGIFLLTTGGWPCGVSCLCCRGCGDDWVLASMVGMNEEDDRDKAEEGESGAVESRFEAPNLPCPCADRDNDNDEGKPTREGDDGSCRRSGCGCGGTFNDPCDAIPPRSDPHDAEADVPPAPFWMLNAG